MDEQDLDTPCVVCHKRRAEVGLYCETCLDRELDNESIETLEAAERINARAGLGGRELFSKGGDKRGRPRTDAPGGPAE